VSLDTARPGGPDDAPLSDGEWETLASLQANLDLGGLAPPAPEVVDLRPVAFIRRLAAWLRWLLDPKADGLPMPPLLDPHRRRRRAARTGRPAAG